MRQLTCIVLLWIVFVPSRLHAQLIRQYALEVSCRSVPFGSDSTVLQFKWPYRSPAVQQQRVYRKSKDVLAWNSVYRILGNNDSTFRDTVPYGITYEYKFEKDTAPDGSTATGYILAAGRLPSVKNRGTILLIADSTHKTFLEQDIRTYRNDLIGDGWYTELKWVDSNTTVNQIKTYIVGRYNASPAQVKSVVLIGNIKTPYSGDFRTNSIYPPDGHSDHSGAWSCDMYYACMGVPYWPDSTVTNTIGIRPANNNSPNDGKFDYTEMPDWNALQVGRIDLADLPAFTQNERTLLRQYFTKNHRYKHRMDVLRERCLLDDNFGIFPNSLLTADEHFASEAYMNMAPLISDTVVYNRDYLTTLDTADYLWSFGFGAGGYTSCAGVANTGSLASATQEIRSVFTGLFGSYFGDWDNRNNLLRAPLAAKGNVLNSFWGGRPIYYFHHMGVGETIGYSVLRTQNNFDSGSLGYLYPTTTFGNLLVHTALMGDPSVRMHTVEPVSAFVARQDGCANRVSLSWTGPSDTSVHTYYIFRAKHIDSAFSLIGETDTNVWNDSFPLNRNNVYMIRGEKLQSSGSGSYFNLSQGIFDTVVLMQVSAGRDTAVCSGSRLTLGTLNNNSSDVVYSWSPAANNRDTFSLTVTSSGSRILIAEDTLGGCIKRDTIQYTALALPQSETISSISNQCNDTVRWNSSLNNGAGFMYHWTFTGGTPATLSGHMLDSPGLVIYPSTGTYYTILRVSDSLTLCENRDTQGVTVVCSGLPFEGSAINCVSTIKGREIRFIAYDNESYQAYRLEGFDGTAWKVLETIEAVSDRYYRFSSASFDGISDVRVMGMKPGNEPVFLGHCEWTDEISEWSVFPNPFSDELHVAYNGIHGNMTTSVEIHDRLGILIRVDNFVFNDSEITLDLSELLPGIYTLCIRTGDRSHTFKLVKI